jgi:hypothetical protein
MSAAPDRRPIVSERKKSVVDDYVHRLVLPHNLERGIQDSDNAHDRALSPNDTDYVSPRSTTVAQHRSPRLCIDVTDGWQQQHQSKPFVSKRSRSNFLVAYRMALIQNVADMQRSGFAIVSMLGANLMV